jgi:L-asparagine transporter-like permease
MFTWMMIFATHLRFRSRFHAELPFRLALYPATPLLGLVLMLALLITTAFVPGFEYTLVSGLPFLALLTVVYFAVFRSRVTAPATVPSTETSTS